MRSALSLALTLALASSAAAVAVAQATPTPKAPKQAGPPTCYVLKPLEVPGELHQWSRVQAGDQWISGCIGPEGQCFTTYWAPC